MENNGRNTEEAATAGLKAIILELEELPVVSDPAKALDAAAILGLAQEFVRVIQPPVGGSFGGKDDVLYQFTAVTARLALMTNRPVRLLLKREESLQTSYKREAMSIQLKIGMDADGIHRQHNCS